MKINHYPNDNNIFDDDRGPLENGLELAWDFHIAAGQKHDPIVWPWSEVQNAFDSLLWGFGLKSVPG